LLMGIASYAMLLGRIERIPELVPVGGLAAKF